MRIVSPQLSRERTPFVGRRVERERLRSALALGSGLITLCGPSGIGKTRLARQVAGEVFDKFEGEGGVWFCSLADCRDAADLEVAVARALAAELQHGDDLARSIANRGPLLLILDNADPVASRCGGLIERWLERCVELQIIMTSLIPTGAAEEILLELDPLEPEDAVALYLDRAHRAWADRSFSGEETSEVEELVHRLDRLPFAIELAAARVRILPPRTMLSMFERRFELLRTSSSEASSSTLEPSHRRSSLLGALELTWSHLEPEEQLALARCAIFEGGFTSDAAAAVLLDAPPKRETSTSDQDTRARSTLDVPPKPETSPSDRDTRVRAILAALHRRSLLLLQDDMEPPRYFLMESVREYSLRKLQGLGRWDEAIRRHASFFLGHCKTEPAWNREPARANPTPWLKRERQNLLAIHQRFLSSDPSFAARAGIALAPLILSEGRSTLEPNLTVTTLDAARRSGAPQLLLAALEATYSAHFREGHFVGAREAMVELIDLAHTQGEREVEAFTLSRLAFLELERGDLESSQPPLEEAVRLSEALGQPRLEGGILLVLGADAFERGALDKAERYLARSVELLREHGHNGSEANSLYTLGLILAHQRRHEEARRAMQEAIEVCRSFGYRTLELHILSNLAKVDLAAGRLDEAEASAEACYALQRELGSPYREGILLWSLGAISLERGDLHLATERLSRADELLIQHKSNDSSLGIRVFLAVLEIKCQHLDEARRILEETRRTLDGVDPSLAAWGRDQRLQVESAEALLDVADARRLHESQLHLARAKVQRARSRLAAIESTPASWRPYLPALLRLLQAELADWEAGAPARSPRAAPPVLTVGEGRAWFQLSGGPRISLHSRRVLRQIFAVLLEARLETPSTFVDPKLLIRAGWPGGELARSVSLKRLHYGVWTLRDLGLRTVVQNAPAGYRLDPAIPVLRMADGGAPP